jgi:hypothetical protein
MRMSNSRLPKQTFYSQLKKIVVFCHLFENTNFSILEVVEYRDSTKGILLASISSDIQIQVSEKQIIFEGI